MNTTERAREILFRLKQEYSPEKGDFILWSTHLELVIGTVLSAQCTDVRVNKVTRELFKKYQTAEDYATASIAQLEKEIGSVTYFRSKSKYLKRIGEILVEKYDGEVPSTMETLTELPGVGKKTASLIMAKAFDQLEGVAVDTHVRRLSQRLELTTEDDPTKISLDLEKIVDREDWLNINEYMIVHGRAICTARKPKCGECALQDICPSAFNTN